MRRVIIVDDSTIITQRLKNIIEETGEYEVVGVASDGAEGIKLFEELKPDLVLLDIVMPVIDGLKCLQVIRNRDPNACVVVISSLGGVGMKVEDALRRGARNVITKPFETDKVLEILGAAFKEEE